MNTSKIIQWGLLGLVVLLIAGGWGKYNTMKGLEIEVDNQWAQVENQYQRRFDLIPNLVNTVKGYADFEKGTLVEVTEARAAALGAMQNSQGGKNLAEFEQADKAVGVAMGRFFGYSENYPELKANQNFLNLQAQLEGTENRVATERMRFNEVVTSYNKSIQLFPGNMYASIFGFDAREYFQMSSGAENAPTVSFE